MQFASGALIPDRDGVLAEQLPVGGVLILQFPVHDLIVYAADALKGGRQFQPFGPGFGQAEEQLGEFTPTCMPAIGAGSLQRLADLLACGVHALDGVRALHLGADEVHEVCVARDGRQAAPQRLHLIFQVAYLIHIAAELRRQYSEHFVSVQHKP